MTVTTEPAAPAKTAKAPPARTATRSEPEPRTPDRSLGDRGPILSRSGKAVSLRITGDIDPFYVPPEIIPPGWTYEWKTRTVYNWEHTQHQVTMAMNGWEPVPAERHDGLFMPKGYDGPIERGGQILMERDDRLTAQSREIDRQNALAPVRASRQMAGLAASQMSGVDAGNVGDFSHAAAANASRVRVGRAPVVESGKYQYSIDE